jgi:hypothetical protein
MAWLGAVLWITATSYLLVQDSKFWGTYSLKWLLYLWIIAAFVVAMAFVRFQFRGRERAAAYTNACVNVAARWLSAKPNQGDLEPTEVRIERWISFPAAVTREVEEQLKNWRSFKGPRITEYLTYFVMAVSTFMLIVRMATV